MVSRSLQPCLYESMWGWRGKLHVADGDTNLGPKPRVIENDVVPTTTNEAELTDFVVLREKLGVAIA
jgi:hypothetical protein